MFFYYSGSEPLSVLVPGEQYAMKIVPSDRSQKTSNEALYNHLFSDEFEHKHLFEKAVDFEPPAKKSAAPVATPGGKDKPVPEKAKTEGGSE